MSTSDRLPQQSQSKKGFKGRHLTYRGRVVYDRKPKIFTSSDVRRIIRAIALAEQLSVVAQLVYDVVVFLCKLLIERAATGLLVEFIIKAFQDVGILDEITSGMKSDLSQGEEPI